MAWAHVIKMQVYGGQSSLALAGVGQHIVCGVVGILGFVGGGFHMHTLFLVLLSITQISEMNDLYCARTCT